MLECGLFAHVMPEYMALFHGQRGREQLLDAVHAGSHSPAGGDDDTPTPAQLLWRFLGALDEYVRDTDHVVHNGVLQAILFAPLVERELGGARQGLDRALDSLMTPVGAALGVARRDRELARQILTTHRRVLDGAGRRRRPALAHRQYFHDALVFLGLAVRAHGGPGRELERWKRLAEGDDSAEPGKGGGGRRRRRGARRRGRGGGKLPTSAAAHDAAHDG
jgi:poly(A) polymerase